MNTPIGPDVARLLQAVADPALSPGGSRLAYTHSWLSQENGEACSRIMMLDLATGQQEEFTQGKAASVPRFAPGGATLGFLRPDEEGRRQVWLMAAGGGEARQLTTTARGVFDFGWSPDARQVVLCADVDPEPPPEDPPAAGTPQVRVVRRIRYRYDTLGWRGDAHFHLFVAPVDGGPPLQVTDGDWDDLSPVWSPDGSRLAFISGRRDDRDCRALTEAYAVPATGGEPEEWSEGLFSVGPWPGRPMGSGWRPSGPTRRRGWCCGNPGSTFWSGAGLPAASPPIR